MNKYKSVDEFLINLDDNKRAQILLLREYILASNDRLEEHVKWNAPSYVFDNEDRITFNTVNKDNLVKLVFHMGAIRKENKHAEPVLHNIDIIEWVSDIRGYVTFTSLEEIKEKQMQIKYLVDQWLSLKINT